MNMLRITFVLLSVIAMQFGCASSDASVTVSGRDALVGDDPVETVKKLWIAAAEGDIATRDSLLSVSAPSGFYQTECPADKTATKSKTGELNAVPSASRSSWVNDLTMRTLAKVARQKFTLDEAVEERIRGDEAMVRIIYSDKPEHMIFETFCLLSRDEAGSWKVFLITSTPAQDNAHFAADRCQPAPKLSSNIEAYSR